MPRDNLFEPSATGNQMTTQEFQAAVDVAAATKWNMLRGVTRSDLDVHAEKVGVRTEVVDSAGRRWQVQRIDNGYVLRPTSQAKAVSAPAPRTAPCSACGVNDSLAGHHLCASCVG